MSQYSQLILILPLHKLLTMRNSTANTFNTLLSFFSLCALLITTCKALRPYHHVCPSMTCKVWFSVTHQSKGTYKGEESHRHIKGREIVMELDPTGSNLPDCSHACGPCMPCQRVTVSFTTCSVESCPVIYRCMCKGKYYHVPSY